MTVFFTPAAQHEWMDVDTVTRILNCLPSHVLALIQDGQLQARGVSGEPRISSASLDRYCEDRPLMGSAPPQTFVRGSGGQVFEELGNGRLRRVR